VQQESNTESQLDRMLRDEFAKLQSKLNYEMGLLNTRVTILEKENEADKLRELLDSKVGRLEFEQVISELKHVTIASVQASVDKLQRDVESIEVSLF
jgi:hypothetical protein